MLLNQFALYLFPVPHTSLKLRDSNYFRDDPWTSQWKSRNHMHSKSKDYTNPRDGKSNEQEHLVANGILKLKQRIEIKFG